MQENEGVLHMFLMCNGYRLTARTLVGILDARGKIERSPRHTLPADCQRDPAE